MSAVDEWLAQRRPGWSLPQPLYLSPEVFDRDIERIFMRSWTFVGHVARIPVTGDYFLYEFGDESVVVIRTDEQAEDGAGVAAFFNVCRPRGSRVCLEDEGRAKGRLVCPYHAWTYSLDGQWASARHMPDSFDGRGMDLHRAEVCVVEGLIFVCPRSPAPDVTGLWEHIGATFAPYGFAEAKIAHRTTHRIRANWKIFAENFWECYHCTHTHPEFCQVMSYPAAAESPSRQADYDRFVADWRETAAREGRLPADVSLEDSGLYQIGRTPIRPGFRSQSRDGNPVAPLMGELTSYDGGISSLQMFPLNWIVASSDHAMLFSFATIGPLETSAELTWIVDGNAVEGRDYDPAEVSWLWEITAAEDWKICEDNQKGVSSRVYQPGPYSQAESGIDLFVDWYLGRVRQGRR